MHQIHLSDKYANQLVDSLSKNLSYELSIRSSEALELQTTPLI